MAASSWKSFSWRSLSVPSSPWMVQRRSMSRFIAFAVSSASWTLVSLCCFGDRDFMACVSFSGVQGGEVGPGGGEVGEGLRGHQRAEGIAAVDEVEWVAGFVDQGEEFG